MRIRRRALLSTGLSSAALWSFGCGFGRRPAPPLRMVVTPWVGNTPFYIAKERGLFGDTDLRIASFGTDFDAWRALADGRADFTTGTLIDILRGTDIGVDLRIPAVVDFSNGADGIVARAGITRIADLAGARVGVEVGTLTHFMLIRALERDGLTEADVKLSNLSMEEALRAFDDGKIDAAAFWEPFLGKAATAGRSTIFTSREIPGEILDVLAVRADVFRDHPEHVALLLAGWERGLAFLRRDPAEGARLAVKYLGMTTAELHEALKGIHLVDGAESGRLFERSRAPSIWTTHESATAFMQKHDILTRPPGAAETLFAPSVARGLLGR